MCFANDMSQARYGYSSQALKYLKPKRLFPTKPKKTAKFPIQDEERHLVAGPFEGILMCFGFGAYGQV